MAFENSKIKDKNLINTIGKHRTLNTAAINTSQLMPSFDNPSKNNSKGGYEPLIIPRQYP